MKITWVILLIVLVGVGFVSGQKGTVSNRASKMPGKCKPGQQLFDKANPVAFLTFLRKERVETETVRGSDADYLFFTLTNNSCWPIWLHMSGEDKRLGDASLYIQVNDIESGTNLRGSLSCHVCSVNPLGTGRKITFSIPFKWAIQKSVMRVSFDFGWEWDEHVDGSAVLHTVNFYFKELPESILPR